MKRELKLSLLDGSEAIVFFIAKPIPMKRELKHG
jgi:hypothetical protein